MPRTYIPNGRPIGRPPELQITDVMAELESMPGQMAQSKRELCRRLRCSHDAIDRVLHIAETARWVERVPGPRGAIGYRLVDTVNE